MNKKIYSFDVFDTVLTRIWAEPKDLFWEIGCHLQRANLIAIAPADWQSLRIEAEKNARRESVREEITLQQIYDCLATSLNWSLDEVEQAKQKEIEVELSSLYPVAETQRKIQALHQKNERVVYISDIYLPQEIIRLFLEQNNIWADGDTLYVSSAVGVRKRSGLLFQHCLAQESIKASQLHHVGDNYKSDVEAPKKLDIKAVEFTQTRLNRYEKLIASSERFPVRFRSLLAGSSRLTRLKCQETTAHKQVIWETAASVMAPVLLGFVNWCLQEAENKGIKRLYFVARDGQILLKIAHVLCQQWGYTIDCRYLYGSRQALKFPAIQSIGKYELDWIFDFPKVFMSVRSVCERVNITPEQIKTYLIAHGFSEINWERNLNVAERALLKQLFQETFISNIILATANNYRDRVIGYLQQEGLVDGTPFGVVDFGWKGSLQKSLSQLLESAGMYPEGGTHGFYFALKRRVEAFPTDFFSAFFFDIANPLEDNNQLLTYSDLYETLVAADHGSTVRFEQENGQFVPILRQQKNDEMLNWGIQSYQQSIVEFVTTFSSVMEKEACSHDYFISASKLLLETFTESPTKEEAITFGSLSHSPDMTEKVLHQLAPKLNVLIYLRMLIGNSNLHHQLWKPGLIARNNIISLLIFNLCLKWQYIKVRLNKKRNNLKSQTIKNHEKAIQKYP